VALDAALHLRSLRLPLEARERDGFPFCLPLIRSLDELVFSAPVTFFVGENGTGKSTLLEGIAAGLGCVAAGSADLARDPTLVAARALGQELRLVRSGRKPRSFFLRLEDLLGFTQKVNADGEELDELARHYDETLTGYGRGLAMGMAKGQRAALTARYGENADARSHGETVLELLRSRIVPGGLYLLDEPETPLSPLRQLALLSLLREMVGKECQFLVATHSPILMALPGASILVFEEGRIEERPWDEVEHVALTRDFLRDPEAFLRRL
jgi:predicted ATPase